MFQTNNIQSFIQSHIQSQEEAISMLEILFAHWFIVFFILFFMLKSWGKGMFGCNIAIRIILALIWLTQILSWKIIIILSIFGLIHHCLWVIIKEKILTITRRTRKKLRCEIMSNHITVTYFKISLLIHILLFIIVSYLLYYEIVCRSICILCTWNILILIIMIGLWAIIADLWFFIYYLYREYDKFNYLFLKTNLNKFLLKL